MFYPDDDIIYNSLVYLHKLEQHFFIFYQCNVKWDGIPSGFDIIINMKQNNIKSLHFKNIHVYSEIKIFNHCPAEPGCALLLQAV